MPETVKKPTAKDPAAATKGRGLSIRFKMVLALSLFTTLTLSLLAGFILIRSRDALVGETTNRGILIGKNLASYSATALLVKDTLTAASLADDAMKNEGMTFAVLTDDKGMVFADGGGKLSLIGRPYQPLLGEPQQVPGLAAGATVSLARDSRGGDEILCFVFPVNKGAVRIGTTYVGLSQSKIQQIVWSLTRDVVVLSLVALLAGLVGAWVLASLIVRPVSRLAQGALAIGRGELDTRIQVRTRDEIGLLADSFNEMASNLKVAQEEKIKKQLIERELNIAHEIQSRLIPKSIPYVPGYEIMTYYKSAEEIGGDYFDVLNLGGRRHGLVVADVSGKGVPGSLGMAVTRSEFRAFARTQIGAAEPLKKTNEAIYPDIKGELFVSMFYAILDESFHSLFCASAGHNPAYWVKGDGKVVEVKPNGAALGLFPPDVYTLVEERVNLVPGDLFVMYTDGITEAKNLAKDEYGEERFMAVLRSGAKLGLEKLKENILADIAAFTGQAPQHDDMTLLVIKRSV